MASQRASSSTLSLVSGVLALLVGLTACGTKSASADDSADSAARSEAARLCHAIDRLREADNAKKSEWLSALSAEPCTSLCQLKQVCASAYQEHVGALDAIRQVKAYGTELPAPGSSAGTQITEKLAEAERRLRESRKRAEQFVESQSEVRRRYRL